MSVFLSLRAPAHRREQDPSVRPDGPGRRAQSGASLADIAADSGFADQSHMSRVVRRLTGLTPLRFARGARSTIGAAFQRATGGGTVYL